MNPKDKGKEHSLCWQALKDALRNMLLAELPWGMVHKEYLDSFVVNIDTALDFDALTSCVT
jgi:hypothetical protein